MVANTQPEVVVPAKPHLTIQDVLAAALGNVLAGLGLGLMTAIATWALGGNAATIAKWSLGMATFWTGFLMWVWFSRDEVANWIRYQDMVWAIEDLEDDNADLEDAIDTLTKRNEYLARENSRLTLLTKGQSNYVPPEAASDPVRQDAETLIDVWANNDYTPPTMRQMQAMGWSQNQFSAARNYLIAAGVIDANVTRSHWLVTDKAAATEAIEIA